MNIYNILSSAPHSMHYLARYIKFIESCKNVNHDKKLLYKESHHIIPKCLYREYSCLKQNNWNKVDLTARQHYIAHWILWKIYPTNIKLQHAFFQFAHWKTSTQKRNDYKFNSKAYEILKTEHSKRLSERMTGRIPPEKERKLASERMKNRVVSEETRNKHSLTRRNDPNLIESSKKNLPPPKYGKDNPFYGKTHTEENLKFFFDSQKGVPMHIRMGSVEKANDVIGRMAASMTGKRWWNNGESCRFSHDSPGENWTLGRLNKGNLGRKFDIK